MPFGKTQVKLKIDNHRQKEVDCLQFETVP